MRNDSRPQAFPPGRLLVVSPHLDVGVFSCGRLLASVPDKVVVTVFAGFPPLELPLTEWDRACGFASGTQAVSARRVEDEIALAALGAEPHWLDFLDRQYCEEEDRPSVAAIADALLAAIRAWSPRTVLFPLGLFHSDHQLAYEATLRAERRTNDLIWIVYADGLFRGVGEMLNERLLQIRARAINGLQINFKESADAAERKARAAACYESQMRALSKPGMVGLDDLTRPEQYWRLRPR